MASIYSLFAQLLFVIIFSKVLTCANAVPANVLEMRTEDLSTGSFSCPSPNIKPVASVINQVLSSSGYVLSSLVNNSLHALTTVFPSDFSFKDL